LAFGLELNNPLSGEATRKRRAAALTARQAVEPAIQQAQAAARDRARSGALASSARAAARGRPHPAQRRAKTLATLSAISREARAEGSRAWAQRRRDRATAEIARRFGHPDFGAYLVDRLARGDSLAAISREAGQHKDWLSRHLQAIGLPVPRPHPSDVRPRPVARRLGYPDVRAYLEASHVRQHRSVASLATQAGVSTWTVVTALRHHGITPVPHAAKRHEAATRSDRVAARLGFANLAEYVADRRASGATWTSLVIESGVPETTLRRYRRSSGDNLRICS
jgi:AraC-like DNA-binding protein